MATEKIITEKSLKELKGKHQTLLQIELPKVLESISEAVSFGDLRENAELDILLKKKGEIIAEINRISAFIQQAIVVYPADFKKVDIGAKVLLKWMEKEISVKLVSEIEADIIQGMVNVDSGFGKAILGLSAGDEFTFNGSSGKVEKVEYDEFLLSN